jgi:serine/threonine protein phosphatase 1
MKNKTNIKTFAIGDIHGNLDLLIKLVEKSIKFNPKKHRLIFLGDYIDRGGNSKGVIEYLSALRKKSPKSVILLMGNHELMAKDFIMGKRDNGLWIMNGGDATRKSFKNDLKPLASFIKTLLPYYETKSHIFCHAGLSLSKNIREAQPSEYLWTRAFRLWHGKKTLVVGHTPVDDVTILPNGVVMVDTGAFFSGVLSAFEITSELVYKAVRKVKTLYTIKQERKVKTEPIATFEVQAEKDEDFVRAKLLSSLQEQLGGDASVEELNELLDREFKAVVA